jgi:hypothetical protein
MEPVRKRAHETPPAAPTPPGAEATPARLDEVVARVAESARRAPERWLRDARVAEGGE